MSQSISEQIKRGMALAFFASAYADLTEECDQPLRGEIMDQLPDEIDSGALHAAETLTNDLLRANWPNRNTSEIPHDIGLALIYDRVDTLIDQHGGGDRDLTPELLGHYLAMQAMGHGVGLSDAFGDAVYKSFVVPYCEFGSHSLQKDYFTSEVQS